MQWTTKTPVHQDNFYSVHFSYSTLTVKPELFPASQLHSHKSLEPKLDALASP
jgi:hypothetical protein